MMSRPISGPTKRPLRITRSMSWLLASKATMRMTSFCLLLRIDLRRQLLCLLGSLNGKVGRDLWFPVTSNQMVKLLFKRKGLLPSSWCNLTTTTCPCVRKGTRIVSRRLGSRKLRSNPGNSTELEEMELVAAALKLPVAAASNWVWRLCCPYLMMSPQRHPGLQAQLLALAQVKLNLKRKDRLRCCPWPSLQVMLRLVGSHATKTLLLFCPYPLVLNWVRRLSQIRHRLGLWQVSFRGAPANPTLGCGAHVCPHQWFGSPCGAYECLDVPFSFFLFVCGDKYPCHWNMWWKFLAEQIVRPNDPMGNCLANHVWIAGGKPLFFAAVRYMEPLVAILIVACSKMSSKWLLKPLVDVLNILGLSKPWYRWPIEIDGLPWFTVLKNGWIFHGELLVITRWYIMMGMPYF